MVGGATATLGLTMVALFARNWTGPDMTALLAAPLLVAGCGCGLLISANQTLTLHEIGRANAGIAAGIYEAGQHVGAGLGTLLSNALFFYGLTVTGGDYHAAAGFVLFHYQPRRARNKIGVQAADVQHRHRQIERRLVIPVLYFRKVRSRDSEILGKL